MHEVIFKTPHEEQLQYQLEYQQLQGPEEGEEEEDAGAEPAAGELAAAGLAHSREWNAARPSGGADALRPNSFTLARSGRLYKGSASRAAAAPPRRPASELDGLMERMQAQAQAHVGVVS